MNIARNAVPRSAWHSLFEEARAGLALLRIEFRRSFCLWLFPFMVAALAWTVYEPLPAGVWLWKETVWSLRSSLMLFGPLVAGLAAWAAGRERRRGIGDLLLTTSRPAPLRDFAVWAATAAWCCLAYATVATGFFLMTLMGATWGSPDMGTFLVGLLAVAALAAVGYAVGAYLPSLFTAPLVAISSYLVLGFTAFFWPVTSLRYLSPLGGSAAPSVFYDESPGVAASQILWFVGLAAIALAAVALKRRRSPVSWTALAAAVALAGVGAVTAAGMAPESAGARGVPVPYGPVCEEGRITVCLHPAYEKALPETVRLVNDLAAPLVGIPGAPIRAEQRGDAYQSRLRPDGTLHFDIRGAFIRWNVENGFAFRDYMAPDLATALVADPSGYVEYASVEAYNSGDACRKSGGPPGEAQRVLAAWLTYRVDRYDLEDPMAFAEATSGSLCPNSGTVIARFDGLDPDERKAWLTKNYADLRAGKLTLDDLP